MSITVTQRFASTDTAPFVTVHPPQAERTCVKSDDALTQEAFDPSDIQADQKWALDSGSNKVVGDDVEWSFTLEDTTDATPLDSSKAWVVAFWTTTGEPVSTRTISPQTAGVSEPVYLVEGVLTSYAGTIVTSTTSGLVTTTGEYNGCDIIIATGSSGRIRRSIVTHAYSAGTHTFTLDADPDNTVEGQAFWILPSANAAIQSTADSLLPTIETRDLRFPDVPLSVPNRFDGVLFSEDVIEVAPGEEVLAGWIFTSRSIVTRGGAVPALLGTPGGLSGQLTATKVGGGIAPKWCNIKVAAGASASVGTEQTVTAEVTNDKGSKFVMAARVRVRTPTA